MCVSESLYKHTQAQKCPEAWIPRFHQWLSLVVRWLFFPVHSYFLYIFKFKKKPTLHCLCKNLNTYFKKKKTSWHIDFALAFQVSLWHAGSRFPELTLLPPGCDKSHPGLRVAELGFRRSSSIDASRMCPEASHRLPWPPYADGWVSWTLRLLPALTHHVLLCIHFLL